MYVCISIDCNFYITKAYFDTYNISLKWETEKEKKNKRKQHNSTWCVRYFENLLENENDWQYY